MMFNRKLIAISITSALVTSSLTVSANTQKPEEQDSVKSWGKWAQQFATAAGGEFNSNALAFVSLGQGEAGRNAQNEADFDAENRYRQYVSWGEGDYEADRPTGLRSASIVFAYTDSQASYVVSSETGGAYESGLIDSDSNLDPRLFVYGQQFFATDGEAGDDYIYLTFEQGNGDYKRGYWYEDTWTDIVDPFEGQGAGYWATNEGFFIEGFASTLEVVNSLATDVLAGNVSANYYGSFLNHESRVSIQLDFGGNPGWTGSFFVPDGPAFTVNNGSINGVDLVGNIDGGEGVSGTVSASFFGDSAGVIAGLAEASVNEQPFVEVFETVRQDLIK